MPQRYHERRPDDFSGGADELAEALTSGGETAAFAGAHVPVPLAFDPHSLRGLSERLIVSHHDKNYVSAVVNLNRVERDLARLPQAAPPFLVGGLKRAELIFTNSMILHEYYFGNLGGDGRPEGLVVEALDRLHRGFGRWEALFRATGASLGGGSGWVVLAYEFRSRMPRTYWSGEHSQAVVQGAPLLVMDMYEHAYQMDYGADFASYIDAVFDNIDWEVVDQRFRRALRAAELLAG